MQVRHGVCNACGARYKLPASFAHDRAKCKQCGGVVEIGPPVADAPAGAPPVPAGKAGPAGKPAAGSPSHKPRRGPSTKEQLLARKQAEKGGGAKPSIPAGAAAAAAEAAAFVGERRHPHHGKSGHGKAGGHGRRSSRHSTRHHRGEEGGGEEEIHPFRKKQKTSFVPLIVGGALVLLLGAMFFFKDAILGSSAEAGDGGVAEEAPAVVEIRNKNEHKQQELDARNAFRDALVAAIAEEGLELKRTNDTKAYAENLKIEWLQEYGHDYVLVAERFAEESVQPGIEPHLVEMRVLAEARAAKAAAIEAGQPVDDGVAKDPATVDLAVLADLPRFVGTTDEEWEEIHELVETLIDPYAGAKYNRALQSLKEYHRKAFPRVMNHFKALDFSQDESVKAGLQINRYLEQATGGHISTGWKDGVTPDDEWFNKRVVQAWYKGIAKVLEDDKQWAGMLKVDLEKIPDPAGLTAPVDELDAALDELDVD
jgi:hypothetical protein